MKILLSAYCFEPNEGSENSVGCHWALEIARLEHDVWVLTRANNRSVIQAEPDRTGPIPNLRFLYCDLPAWARWWKKGQRGVRLYYLLWQRGAYRLARKVHADVGFDRVHHITFGVVRSPSFMGNLSIPFIFGPVGGGERAPWKLRSGYGLRGVVLDALRDIGNWLIKFDPLMRQTFKQAERIYVTSDQSRDVLPPRYRPKTAVQLAVGLDADDASFLQLSRAAKGRNSHPKRFLFVGRFLFWKGMHLGLPAFAKILESIPSARLTMVGQGPEERYWRRLASGLGIAENVEWVPWKAKVERNLANVSPK